MASYVLTAHSYDQPLKGDDPPDRRKLHTYRLGDVVEFVDGDEKSRLLSLGAVEEAPEAASSPEDAGRETEERRKLVDSQERAAAKGQPKSSSSKG